MTDLELHDWALLRYGSEDLANKLAIVGQMRTDDETEKKKVVSVDFKIWRIHRRRRNDR
jgi:hypothetical protein